MTDEERKKRRDEEESAKTDAEKRSALQDKAAETAQLQSQNWKTDAEQQEELNAELAKSGVNQGDEEQTNALGQRRGITLTPRDLKDLFAALEEIDESDGEEEAFDKLKEAAEALREKCAEGPIGPDNALPEHKPGQPARPGAHPDHDLPENKPGRPDQGLPEKPGAPAHPDNKPPTPPAQPKPAR